MTERRTWVRVVLALLAIGPLATGLWAVLDPSGWFESFPGLGRAWVVVEGPFNHHLSVDAGAGFLAVGVALVAALVWAKREAIQVALVAFLVHTVPHFLYHLTHPVDELGAVDQVLSTGGLGVQWVLAIAVLVAVSRTSVTAQRVAA